MHGKMSPKALAILLGLVWLLNAWAMLLGTNGVAWPCLAAMVASGMLAGCAQIEIWCWCLKLCTTGAQSSCLMCNIPASNVIDQCSQTRLETSLRPLEKQFWLLKCFFSSVSVCWCQRTDQVRSEFPLSE